MRLFTYRTLLLAATFTFAGLTACTPEEDMGPTGELGAESMQLSRAQNPNDVKLMEDHYIVISSTESLPAGLAKKLTDLNGEVTSSLDAVGIVTVKSSDPNFANKAGKISGIRSVVRDLDIQWFEPENHKTIELTAAMQAELAIPDAVAQSGAGSTNPLFALQWGHLAINAPAAWSNNSKGKGARVAILDSGFNTNHPDLRPNLDLAASANFVPGEQLQFAGGTSHGSHVAGTVAATDDNVGVVGVAPEATLIFVKVMNSDGRGAFSWIMQGIVHAVEKDADVINMSLGAALPHHFQYITPDGKIVNDTKAIQETLVAMSRVTNYAYRENVTVISSAGNSGLNGNTLKDLVYIPAQSSNVISISSTAPIGWAINSSTNLDNLSSFSNYGTNLVAFAAPGGDFSYPGEESATIAGVSTAAWVFDMVLSTTATGWGWSAGTSMAAPHAAGVAALIIGQNGGKMAPAQVLAKMRATADDLGKPGRDPFYGYGRLNAYRAVTQ